MSPLTTTNDRYRPPPPAKFPSIMNSRPRQRAKVISPNIRYEKNGLVSMSPAHSTMQALTNHNSGTTLLSLPPEIRNMIFKHVLGHRAIHIYAVPGIETREHPRGYVYDPDEFALTRVCRQIHAETALLPYSLNTFVFTCRVDRDRWVSRRTFAQLDAVLTIEVRNVWLYDAINGTNEGGCIVGCWEKEDSQCGDLSNKGRRSWMGNIAGPAAQLMPFSFVFSKLKKIVVRMEEVMELVYLAEDAEYGDWVEFVKMRERDGVEVVEVNSSFP